MTTSKRSRSYLSRGKRALDLLILVGLAPLWVTLLLLLAVPVRCFQGRKIFFRQIRSGLGGRPFTLLKYRTMAERRDEFGNLLPDEARLTRLGRLLRRTSLDELPELINVVKGEMSLVGPRPLLMDYLPLYSREQARRHEVLPGVTGWAQVNGRNALSWEEKFRFDVWYVDNVSFGLDLKILCLTLWKVLSGEGMRAEGHATMPEFVGNRDE